MTLFLFAHPLEAKITLETLKAKQTTMKEDLYAFDQGYILITGMGLYNSLFATTAFLQNYGSEISQIINLGFCASLDSNLPIGSIVSVQQVEKWIEHPPLDQESEKIKERCCPTFHLQQLGKKLMSVDYSIFDPISREKILAKADLIDMEGYSICFANQFFTKKLIIRKIVSDFATKDGRENIKKNHLWLSTLLANESLTLITKELNCHLLG